MRKTKRCPTLQSRQQNHQQNQKPSTNHLPSRRISRWRPQQKVAVAEDGGKS